MLDKTQMQEIQDLKLRGYTKAEILTYYKEQGLKPPSRPTISVQCIIEIPKNAKQNGENCISILEKIAKLPGDDLPFPEI